MSFKLPLYQLLANPLPFINPKINGSKNHQHIADSNLSIENIDKIQSNEKDSRNQKINLTEINLIKSSKSSHFLMPNMNQALQNILNFKKNKYLLNMGPNSGDSSIILNSF